MGQRGMFDINSIVTLALLVHFISKATLKFQMSGRLSNLQKRFGEM